MFTNGFRWRLASHGHNACLHDGALRVSADSTDAFASRVSRSLRRSRSATSRRRANGTPDGRFRAARELAPRDSKDAVRAGAGLAIEHTQTAREQLLARSLATALSGPREAGLQAIGRFIGRLRTHAIKSAVCNRWRGAFRMRNGFRADDGAAKTAMARENRCAIRLPEVRAPHTFILHRSLPPVTGRSALARKAPSRHRKSLRFPCRC